MTKKSHSFISYAVSLLVLAFGMTVMAAIRSSLEEQIKESVMSELKDFLVFAVSQDLRSATWKTIFAFVLSSGATVIVGVFLAWLIYSYRLAASVLEPLVQIMRPIPSIAMIAIGTLIVTATSSSLAFVVAFLGSLWPFTVAALDEFRRVPDTLRLSTITLGKPEGVFYREVLFRTALPGLFNVMRLVAPITLLLTVTTQYIYPGLGGLGALLYERHNGLKYSHVICIIAVMSLLSILFEGGITWIERRICRWTVEEKDAYEAN